MGKVTLLTQSKVHTTTSERLLKDFGLVKITITLDSYLSCVGPLAKGSQILHQKGQEKDKQLVWLH